MSDYFSELNNELSGWTIDKFDGFSEHGEAFRLIVTKDDDKKAVVITATDLGMELDYVNRIDKITGHELHKDLPQMVNELQHHADTHLMENNRMLTLAEPIFTSDLSDEEYATLWLDYWMNIHDSISSLILFNSHDENILSYIVVDDSVMLHSDNPEWALELWTFNHAISDKLGIRFIYVNPSDVKDVIAGNISLPSVCNPECYKNGLELISTPIESKYYKSYEDKKIEKLSDIKELFELKSDPRNLQYGFICSDCHKEWWTSVVDIVTCKNAKLKQLMSSPDTQYSIFDDNCWFYDGEEEEDEEDQENQIEE